MTAAAATLLGAVYLGALGGTIAALRILPPVDEGAWRVVLLLGILVFSDSFAFFVGHAIGRRRLAPSVSPGKSVEGALGGLVGGVLGALAVRHLGLPDLPAPARGRPRRWRWPPWASWATSTRACSSAGRGSRTRGRSSPGHGGMLDRLDSLLFGAPVLYYYFQYVH